MASRGSDTSSTSSRGTDSSVYSNAGRGTDAGGVSSAYRGGGGAISPFANPSPPLAQVNTNYGYGAAAPPNMGAYNAAATGPYALNNAGDDDKADPANQRLQLAMLTQQAAQNPAARAQMMSQYLPGIGANQELLRTPGVDQARLEQAQRFLQYAQPLVGSLANNSYAQGQYGANMNPFLQQYAAAHGGDGMGGSAPQMPQMQPQTQAPQVDPSQLMGMLSQMRRPQFNTMPMQFGQQFGGQGGQQMQLPPQFQQLLQQRMVQMQQMQQPLGGQGMAAQYLGRPSMGYDPMSMARFGGYQPPSPSGNPYAMSFAGH